MKRLVSLSALMLAFVGIFAQTMTNASGRNTYSLDGEWKYIVDPYGHGNGSFWQDGTFDGSSVMDYDFNQAPTLHVPGDWNTQRTELYFYEGNVWYRTRFEMDNTALKTDGKRLFLHFDAANYRAKVWLNGKEVGSHEGGYAPFEFDITDRVKLEGENSLVVRVDNTRLTDGIPTTATDWWNYGGLTRSVYLIEVPETYLYDYSLQLDSDMKSISGYVELRGENKAQQQVTIDIAELKIHQTITTDAEGRASFTMKAKRLQLWSPDAPKLYDVCLSLGGEALHDDIGFRTITTSGGDILLNGKKIFLAGVNIHEETIGDSRRAVNADDDMPILQEAKDLGCNFVRLAHYPHNEDMIKMADRLGLMVWSEIPLYWGINWTNAHTYELAEQQLHEMIGRDHNRASVIIWSIANETAVNAERNDFLTRLANEAHRIDNTRLVSAALQTKLKHHNPTVYTLTDPMKDVLDVIAFNEYIGWYDGKKEYCDKVSWELPTDKPVVISEFGGGAKLGHHSGNDKYFSEEYLADLYRHHLNMLDRIEGLDGTIPWVLKDFRSPRRMIPGIQDGFNRKGLISEKGIRKQAWQVVKDWNSEKND